MDFRRSHMDAIRALGGRAGMCEPARRDSFLHLNFAKLRGANRDGGEGAKRGGLAPKPYFWWGRMAAGLLVAPMLSDAEFNEPRGFQGKL